MFGTLKHRIIVGLVTLPAGFVLVGCDKPAAQSNPAARASANDTLPADLFVREPIPEPTDLLEMKMHAGEGDEVLVRAKVGGRADPFVEGRAAMTVMDPKVKSCNQIPGDKCESPWDYCCEPKENIVLNSATVQVVGPDGKPLRATLKGANGLKPLDEVLVHGTMKKSPDGKAIVINARRIFVKPAA